MTGGEALFLRNKLGLARRDLDRGEAKSAELALYVVIDVLGEIIDHLGGAPVGARPTPPLPPPVEAAVKRRRPIPLRRPQ